LPDRLAHCRGRTARTTESFSPRSPDCRRSDRRRHGGPAARDKSGSFLGGRGRRNMPVLPPRHGKPVR
jgi:hypothetical protein